MVLNLKHPGQHDYDGRCRPGQAGGTYQTFSVGIFEWVPRVRRPGLKRGPVKVRVVGRCGEPDRVYQRAREIIRELDLGSYCGPKRVELM